MPATTVMSRYDPAGGERDTMCGHFQYSISELSYGDKKKKTPTKQTVELVETEFWPKMDSW